MQTNQVQDVYLANISKGARAAPSSSKTIRLADAFFSLIFIFLRFFFLASARHTNAIGFCPTGSIRNQEQRTGLAQRTRSEVGFPMAAARLGAIVK